MSKFKIEITSVLDRDKLVAEIWFEEELIAELNREEDKLKIILFNTQESVFLFEDFFCALLEAKRKLV